MRTLKFIFFATIVSWQMTVCLGKDTTTKWKEKSSSLQSASHLLVPSKGVIEYNLDAKGENPWNMLFKEISGLKLIAHGIRNFIFQIKGNVHDLKIGVLLMDAKGDSFVHYFKIPEIGKYTEISIPMKQEFFSDITSEGDGVFDLSSIHYFGFYFKGAGTASIRLRNYNWLKMGEEYYENRTEPHLYTPSMIPAPQMITYLKPNGFIKIATRENQIFLLDNNNVKLKIAAAEVNNKLQSYKRPKLPVTTYSGDNTDQQNITGIAIASINNKEALRKIGVSEDILNEVSLLPDDGYMITILENNKLVLVVGKTAQGALYGCETIRYLLCEIPGSNVLGIPCVLVKDWPDFKLRAVGGGLKVPYRIAFSPRPFRLEKGLSKAKKAIDWCLRHKINVINDPKYPVLGNSDLYEDPDRQQWKWLRKVNDYAFARGVLPMGVFFGSIGYSKKLDNAMNKCVIDHNERYYCWSRDDLIKKRFAKIAEYVKSTGIKLAIFHMPDAKNQKWHNRCESCRKRFGNDQAEAIAHVGNLFYSAIKAMSPGTTVGLVPRPYFLNLDYKENRAIKERLEKLSQLLPRDMYVVRTAGSRAAAESWKKAFKQPILFWLNPNGKYSCNLLGATAPTYHFKKSEDGFHLAFSRNFLWTPDLLLGAEYSWNANTPGGIFLRQGSKRLVPMEEMGDKHLASEEGIKAAKETILVNGTPFSEWYYFTPLNKKTKQLAAAYRKTCIDLYGVGIDSMIASKMLGCLFLPTFMDNPRRFLKNNCVDLPLSPSLIARATVSTLETRKEVRKAFASSQLKFSPKQMGAMLDLYKKLIAYTEKGKCLFTLVLAESTLRVDNIAQAKMFIELTENGIKQAGENSRNLGPSVLRSLHKSLETYKSKIMILKIITRMKEKIHSMSVGNAPVLHYLGGEMRVGLYDPTKKHGVVFGTKALRGTLRRIQNLTVISIDEINNKTIKNLDAVFIPDCKKLGDDDDQSKIIATLRKYVEIDGGCLYFQHDSVGSGRSPLQASIFPEICSEAISRIKSDKVSPVVESILSNGFKFNNTYEHMYYDHYALEPGFMGESVFVDEKGHSVVVAGFFGNGRVVFDGTITYHYQKSDNAKMTKGTECEVDKANKFNDKVINNAIAWFKGESIAPLEIIVSQKKKINTTLAESGATILEMRLILAPLKNIKLKSVTITAYDTSGQKLQSKILKKIPKKLTRLWISPEKISLTLGEMLKRVLVEIKVVSNKQTTTTTVQFQ